MMLEPERAAVMVAERLRRPRLAAAGESPDRERETSGMTRAERRTPVVNELDWVVQRTLEELGIHCERVSSLQDLKGFLIASHRGAEIVVSDRLTPEERLTVYVHLLAHALLETPDRLGEKESSFYSRLEYVEGRGPSAQSGAERRAEMVADALAKAILRGRLDGAPQYTYRQRREPAETSGLRPRLGRLVLEICHRASLALFWHSLKYQRLRGRPEMSELVRRVEGLVRVAYAC